jgi:signal transduction histidine kinase
MNLITTSLAAVSVLLAFIGYTSFHQIKVYEKNWRISLDSAELLENLQNKRVDEATLKELQQLRADIFPEKRKMAFSDIIQAYSSENKSLLKKRAEGFLDNEKVYAKNFAMQRDYIEKKLYFYSIALFCSIFSLLLGLNFYLTSQVFMPIQTTTQRMIDFLNGKYSYSFDTPEENEMGELQSTFNSMAQEVLKNMEELKALDAAKSDFLNIASHELRTPMTSIKGSLSLISTGIMGKIPKEILSLIEIAEMETDRLVRLINDILDMAKMDARKLPLKLSWAPLHSIIDKTILSLQGIAQTFDVKVEKHTFEDIDVYADADRIQQVITNLVSNAVKFSPQKGTVEILVEVKAREPIKIMVRDHGKGMTPQEKSILFQKFRQISSPDNPLVKGTGLGLAIAKALVEEHNGKIDVHTKPNEGSTFYFTLPEWRHKNSTTSVAA